MDIFIMDLINSAVNLDYIAALKAIPDTGLDKFEQNLIAWRKAEASRRVALYNFFQAHPDEFAAIVQTLTDPRVLQAKTAKGKNIAHLLAEYCTEFPHSLLLAMSERHPALLTEAEPESGFTPAFYFVLNESAYPLTQFVKINPNIALQRDAQGNHLAFWAAGHGADQGLYTLDELGLNVFEKVDGADIIDMACAKYMQSAIPDIDQLHTIYAAMRMYLQKNKETGLHELTARARSKPKQYAPLLACLSTLAQSDVTFEEVLQTLKQQPPQCNISEGSNATTHILYALLKLPNKTIEMTDVWPLANRDILGDNTASPAFIFNKTDADVKHSAGALISDKRRANAYLADTISMALVDGKESTYRKATPPALSKAFITKLFDKWSADPLTEYQGKTLGDIAIAANRKDIAQVVKNSIDAALTTPATAHTQTENLRREQSKLTAFLGIGKSG